MPKTRVLILANGDWTGVERLHELQAGVDWTLAADGGWARAREAGLHVDTVLGDLDSVESEDRIALERSGLSVWPFLQDKDWTDLELAVDHALAFAPEEIWVFGGLGGRLDHTMTNLHLLEKGVDLGVRMVLLTATGTVQLAAGRTELREVALGDRVSLVPITPCVTLSTSGLRFELHEERLKRAASRGVSNVVVGSPVVVDVRKGRLFIFHDRPGGGLG